MHSDFPSNETLAAFIDGRLDARTRSSVEQHLVACSDCYALIADATAAREAVGEADFEPRAFATPMPDGGKLLPFRTFAAAAAIAAGLAVVYFVPAIHDVVPGLGPPGIGEIVQLAGNQRVTLTRIAAINQYRAPAPTYRGGGDGSSDEGNDVNYDALQGKAAEIAQAAKEHPTRRNLHTLGVALLLVKKPVEAVSELEKARQLGTPDADLLNDLSAAYMDRRFKKGSQPDDAKAVTYAEQAWQIEKNPASRWNRAVALEKLNRTEEAKAAWRDYLQVEDDPGWREEAVQHLKDIKELNEFSVRR
jgi:tetratricopeptide (TPR) repeat protein